MKGNFHWPPDYSVKKHPRARHVKLKTSMQRGLEIITPLRFNQKHIPEILEIHKEWIQKKLLRLKEKSEDTLSDILPVEIKFNAFHQTWKIFYIKTKDKHLRLVIRPNFEIAVVGDIDDKEICKLFLMKWIRKYADKCLGDKLIELSKLYNLPFGSFTLRSQKTRWGSCTSKKNISLNYKLVFLPENIMRYVLIHELCHTVHLNHSVKFWRQVALFDPEWKVHNKQLKSADSWVPTWLMNW